MTGPRDANIVDQHVGARLRLRRMQLGLSQSTLGEKIGVTFQQVQKYERGNNRIGASRLWAISEVLSVPVEWFFEGLVASSTNEAHSLASDPFKQLMETNDGIKFAKAINAIPPGDVRRQVLQFARTLGEMVDD